MECKVFYTTCIENNEVVLDVEYEASLVGDECEETIVGITNHRYESISNIEQSMTKKL